MSNPRQNLGANIWRGASTLVLMAILPCQSIDPTYFDLPIFHPEKNVKFESEGDHFYQPPQLIFIITITWSWPATFGWRTMVGPKIPVNPIREALIVRKCHPFLYHWYNKHSLSPFKYVHSFYSSLKWIYLQTIWTVTQQCRWYLSTTEGTSHFHLDILTIFVMS